jgi:hypothetical protein
MGKELNELRSREVKVNVQTNENRLEKPALTYPFEYDRDTPLFLADGVAVSYQQGGGFKLYVLDVQPDGRPICARATISLPPAAAKYLARTLTAGIAMHEKVVGPIGLDSTMEQDIYLPGKIADVARRPLTY